MDLPNYGPNHRSGDTVADFLLGGDRKRLVVERLADPAGWTAAALIKELQVGRSTVFEVVRALRAAEALDDLGSARYQLSKKTPLGKALRELLVALDAVGHEPIDRPPRTRYARTRVPTMRSDMG
jgi:hypothetical protein